MDWLLLAEGDIPWWAAVVVAAIGAAAPWLWSVLRQNRQDVIAELYQILDRQQKDLDKQRDTIHDLRDELQVSKVSEAVCRRELVLIKERLDLLEGKPRG